MFADIVDMFVDLVSNNDDFRMFFQYFSQSCQLFCIVDRTCRVGRRAEDQCFCLRCDSCFQLGRSDLEILFDTSRNDYRFTFSQFNHFRIANPERSWNDHFISGINQYQDSITNGLLCSIRARNLSSCIFQSVFILQFGYDSIA